MIAVIDSSGVASAINTYDEYGMRGGANNAGRFQYTGQAWLAEVSLYHYRARAYDPSLGRFMQTDPILHAGGVNLYAYVANDPVNLTDPFGLQEEEVAVWGRRPQDSILRELDFLGAISVEIPDPFQELTSEGGEIVVTGQRQQRPSAVNVVSWAVRRSPLAIFLSTLIAPTDVADATCRSADNPGGYDCTVASEERPTGPPYQSTPSSDYEDALRACQRQCLDMYGAGSLPGPRGVRGSDMPGNLRRCVRDCLRERGDDDQF